MVSAPPAVSMGERLRVIGGLVRHFHKHDLRAGRTFLQRTYSKLGWPARVVRFCGWFREQCWSSIPQAMRGVSFQSPVSATPVWLAEGNPFAGHPWTKDARAVLPERADAVVIGAGFTGASLAYHWAKSGTSGTMVVLDMDDPASGASGRNAGEVVMGRYFAMVFATVRKHLPRVRPNLPAEALDRLAQQFASTYCRAAYRNADLVEATIRDEGFACDYAREGWVQERGAGEQSVLADTVRLGREHGFDDWDRLEAEQASQKTGAAIAFPANYSRRAARFHPAKWVWCLFARALQSASVALFTRTKVTAVVDEGEMYRVTTERGTILARHVVNATEAYTATLHARFSGIISARQSQATYGLDEGRSVKPNVPFSGSTFFCVRHGKGILFGSDETPIPDRDTGHNRASRFITMFVIAQLRERFGAFPLRVTNEWAGSVGFTADEYPVVGTIDGKRHYLIAGMSGSGTAVSFNAGRCICARMLGHGDGDDYPPAYFSPLRLLDPAGHVWPDVDPHEERKGRDDA